MLDLILAEWQPKNVDTETKYCDAAHPPRRGFSEEHELYIEF